MKTNRDRQTEPQQPDEALKPSSPEEARVWKVLEEARQNVKQIAKREVEGEVITGDILNLRLKVRA